MLETIKKQWDGQFAVVIFLVLTVWWLISPSFQQSPDVRFFGDFGSIYVIMALLGGIWGIRISEKWGGIKSIMGRATLMFSLGLFAQAFGQLVYAYYSFYKHISVPYPSLGDVGYFGSIPLYIYGVILLGQASGVKLGLRSFKNKIQAVIIPIAMLILSYTLFLQEYEFDWSNPVKIFLDFGYPLTQAIYVSLAMLTYLLSKNVLGGIMKNKIFFILIALGVQFLSDYTFLYQSIRGIWSVGGFNDYMYLISYFVMTLALLQLRLTALKLRGQT